MKSSLEIAQEAELRPIEEIAAAAGLEDDEVEPYGRYKAKIRLSVLGPAEGPARRQAHLRHRHHAHDGRRGQDDDARSSLTQGMGAIGEQALAVPARALARARSSASRAARPAAATPGRADGGPQPPLHRATCTPSPPPTTCSRRSWTRTSCTATSSRSIRTRISLAPRVDMNDRAPAPDRHRARRRARTATPRETGFDITAASEVMAILALARDLHDLRRAARRDHRRLQPLAGEAVTAEELGAAGAMAVLLKDAIKPNLVQTLEGQPCLDALRPVREHRARQLVARSPTASGSRSADYVVTESGFGADMGMQKFMDIVCRFGGLRPAAVVVVVTVRALRAPRRRRGRLGVVAEEALTRCEAGIANLAPPSDDRSGFGLPVRRGGQPPPGRHRRGSRARAPLALEAGAHGARDQRRLRATAAKGAAELAARRRRGVPTRRATSSSLYPDEASIEDKIEAIATRGLRRRRGRLYSRGRAARSTQFTSDGSATCRSAWPRRTCRSPPTRSCSGAPNGFTVRSATSAPTRAPGWLVPLCGDIMQMPGLGKTPAGAEHRHRRRTGARSGCSRRDGPSPTGRCATCSPRSPRGSRRRAGERPRRGRCALGAGLVEMAAAFAPGDEHDAVRPRRAAALRADAIGLAEADLTAYEAVLAAMRLSPGEPDRGERLDAALSARQRGSAGHRKRGLRGGASGRRGARTSSVHLRGDAASGPLLAEAACRAAARLVEINLAGRPDDPRAEEAAALAREAASARLAALAPASSGQSGV